MSMGIGRHIDNAIIKITGIGDNACVRVLNKGFLPAAPHIKEKTRINPNIDAIQMLNRNASYNRCVIVGTSPHVNTLDLSLAQHEYIFALNGAFKLNKQFKRDLDGLVMSNKFAMWEYGVAALANNNWRDIFLSTSGAYISGFQPKEAFFFDQWAYPKMHNGFFEHNLRRPLYQSNTVAHSALQIAVGMGFSNIVMIGIDLDFDLERPHFYDTMGAESKRVRTTSRKNKRIMIEGFLAARKIIEECYDISVINAGKPDGNNPFDHIPWDRLF